MDVVVGIDVGTTWCKAVVTEPGAARVLGKASTRTPWTTVSTGAEMAPTDLLDTVVQAAETAVTAAGSVHPVGVGVTGMAESGVLLNRVGASIAPIIAWYDTRGTAEAAELSAAIPDGMFEGITGLVLDAKPSIFPYLWLQRHHPHTDRGVTWLSVPEWVAFALIGGGSDPAAVPRSEGSLVGRTGFFDVLAQEPSPQLMAWCEAPDGLIPPVADRGEALGAVAADYRPIQGAAVTVAGHDHAVAKLGVGATGRADVLDSCGTGESLVRAVPTPQTAEAVAALVRAGLTIDADVAEGGMLAMAAMGTGRGLRRFQLLMGVADDERDALDDAAIALGAGSSGPVRVDDIWTPQASIHGLNFRPDRAVVWRAAIECAQHRVAHFLRRLESVAGASAQIIATGGGLDSRAVRVIKEEVIGPFKRADIEAGCIGATHLASVAAGSIPLADVGQQARQAAESSMRAA